MATRTYTNKYYSTHLVIPQKSAQLVHINTPRRCMIASMGLVLAGLSIPFLMFFELIPITLLSGLVGLALTAIGGFMGLVYYGDI